MPVIFFPYKQIDALETIIQHIDKTPLLGEIDVYRKLYNELDNREEEFYIWHDIKFATHSEDHNPYRKSESQMDFVIACKYGVCVIEVKGGQVEFQNGAFYFRHKGNLEQTPQNPLKQVEGYKYTLKDKILELYSKKKLFIDVCVFPHTSIDYSRHQFLFGQIIYTKFQENGGLSLGQFIINRFNSVKTDFEPSQ